MLVIFLLLSYTIFINALYIRLDLKTGESSIYAFDATYCSANECYTCTIYQPTDTIVGNICSVTDVTKFTYDVPGYGGEKFNAYFEVSAPSTGHSTQGILIKKITAYFSSVTNYEAKATSFCANIAKPGTTTGGSCDSWGYFDQGYGTDKEIVTEFYVGPKGTSSVVDYSTVGIINFIGTNGNDFYGYVIVNSGGYQPQINQNQQQINQNELDTIQVNQELNSFAESVRGSIIYGPLSIAMGDRVELLKTSAMLQLLTQNSGGFQIEYSFTPTELTTDSTKYRQLECYSTMTSTWYFRTYYKATENYCIKIYLSSGDKPTYCTTRTYGQTTVGQTIHNKIIFGQGFLFWIIDNAIVVGADILDDYSMSPTVIPGNTEIYTSYYSQYMRGSITDFYIRELTFTEYMMFYFQGKITALSP